MKPNLDEFPDRGFFRDDYPTIRGVVFLVDHLPAIYLVGDGECRSNKKTGSVLSQALAPVSFEGNRIILGCLKKRVRLQPRHGSCAGAEFVGFNAHALEHGDEQVAQGNRLVFFALGR